MSPPHATRDAAMIQQTPAGPVAARNIILAGFMGSGKSSVGRALAERLNWRLLDTDRQIETEQEMGVARIFEERGEKAFRDMETTLALKLVTLDRCVVATGGGFMVRPVNRTAALKAGVVVLLVASAEQIWQRVKASGHRPLLAGEDPQGRIAELLEARQSAYNAIDFKIDTNGLTTEFVAEKLIDRLRAE